MRRSIALAFILGMSMITIGVAAPDHQICSDPTEVSIDQITQFQSCVIVEFSAPAEVESISEINPIDVNSYRIVTSVVDVGILSRQVQTEGGLTNARFHKEIIEKSDKPKDRYRLPIWEYIPNLQPPSNLKILS